MARRECSLDESQSQCSELFGKKCKCFFVFCQSGSCVNFFENMEKTARFASCTQPRRAAPPPTMFHHHYHHAVVRTPPITPVAPTTNTNANTVTAAAATAITSSSRSFADYRYAIEAGLISPHHERCYTPSWEQQPSHRHQTPGGAVSSRKRYFTPSSDEDDEEEGSGDANQMMTFQYQGAVRCVSSLHPSPPEICPRKKKAPPTSASLTFFFYPFCASLFPVSQGGTEAPLQRQEVMGKKKTK